MPAIAQMQSLIVSHFNYRNYYLMTIFAEQIGFFDHIFFKTPLKSNVDASIRVTDPRIPLESLVFIQRISIS